MKILALIARILMGLAFVFFGANGFLNFMVPPPMPDSPAARFSAVMMSTHYTQVVCAIMIISGILFLIGRYIPLALVLIGPVIVNILLFHLLMAPATIAPGLVVTACWFIVFFHVRSAFAGIFQAKVAG